jgi:hypothetical protein
VIKARASLLLAAAVLGGACASGGGKHGAVISGATDSDGGVDAAAADAGQPAPIVEDAGKEVDAAAQPGICGDNVCNSNETCGDCSPDCGECPKCDLAPTCTGSVAVPSFSKHLQDFDNGDRTLYSSGVDQDSGVPLGVDLDKTDCIAPELRMRVRQVKIELDGVNLGTANVFCTINASDGSHSEVMITPAEVDIGDHHPPIVFPPEASTFWGQGKNWQTLNNLTITYQCFDDKNNGSYKAVFDALQNGANAAGGIAGPWGWAFGVGSTAAGLISAAIPAGHAEERMNVQQTIDKSMLLELTNGRVWEIHSTGDAPGIGGNWDWTVEVEAWGCSDARPPKPE